MESDRFKFDKNLDIEAKGTESNEEIIKRQFEIEEFVKSDGVVFYSPTLEPALAEDLEEDS